MKSNIFIEVFGQAVLRSAILIAVFMTLFFIYALYRKRNDIADVVWGIGFIVVAWFNFYAFGFQTELFPGFYGAVRMQTFLVALVVTIWGLRLAIHIALRNVDKPEDFRYKNWRDTWGKWFVVRSFFQIFVLQGFLMLLISLPIIAVSIFGLATISWITIVGFLIWLNGFIFEAGGDYQLTKFIKDPLNKGKIMTKGLWSFTRHPNYFGEVTQWWGVYLMSLPILFSTFEVSMSVWVISLLGPLTITFLILKVSGIPMLEKKYDDNADFQEYKKKTNAFFPWFPKNL